MVEEVFRLSVFSTNTDCVIPESDVLSSEDTDLVVNSSLADTVVADLAVEVFEKQQRDQGTDLGLNS